MVDIVLWLAVAAVIGFAVWMGHTPTPKAPDLTVTPRAPGEPELVAPPVARERLRFTSPAFERLSVPEQEETVRRLESVARGMFRGKKP